MRANPIFAALLGDPETEALFSAEAMLADWLAFQIALTRAQGLDPEPLQDFAPDPGTLTDATCRDGVPIPAWLKALKEHAPGLAGALHLNATSQDLTDTALVLALKRANVLFHNRIDGVLGGLRDLKDAQGSHPLTGRTRMQVALPMTVGDRIIRWLAAIEEIGTKLSALRYGLEVVQYGGAIGMTPHDAVKSAVAAELGLTSGLNWHTTRLRLADYASWMSLATGTLGKLGQDIALMAQMDEVTLKGGTSSAMPHKNNPVLAEVLVALARKNATDLSAAHLALIAEQERSGASMTLEWLTLPQMVVTTGAALRHAETLVASVKRMGAQAG